MAVELKLVRLMVSARLFPLVDVIENAVLSVPCFDYDNDYDNDYDYDYDYE